MQKHDFLKTEQFRALLTVYWRPIGSYVIGLFKKPIIGSLKSKMAEIHHRENRHDVIFFCRGWSDLDKISETGAEWHVDCSDVVEIETRCRILIWRTFGRIQWHVIWEPPATLQGAATGRIQWRGDWKCRTGKWRTKETSIGGNARLENDGTNVEVWKCRTGNWRTKSQGLKMQDWKMTDLNLTDQNNVRLCHRCRSIMHKLKTVPISLCRQTYFEIVNFLP